MKTSCFIILVFLLAKLANAQSNYSEGFIDYEFIHYFDTNNIEKQHKETLRLYYNANLAVYKSLSRTMFDSLTQSRIEKAALDNQFNNLKLGQLPTGSIEQFFTSINNQLTITYRKFLKVNYLMIDSTLIDWKLSSDTLTILGYPCQKAVGYFKGRTYIAWFSSNLPFSIGPWKLKGLPGIILKAEDTKKQVIFLAKAINPYRSIIDIKLPDNPKYTTSKALMNAIKAYRENPNSIQPDGLINIEAKDNSMLKKTTKANNPVELME